MRTRNETDEWRCWRCRGWNSPRRRHCFGCGKYRFAPQLAAVAAVALVAVVWLLRS